MSRYATTPPDLPHMPPGVPYIIGNEAAERFSFYGMKSILTVFMTQHLLTMSGASDVMSDETAKQWLHDFVAAVYFFPVLGALFSDWLTGKYRMIMGLSLVYCAGHFVLALMEAPHLVGLEPRTLLAIGLTLIAIGAGGIKPCVSAHVGDQFGRKNSHLLTKVFGWFYFSINLGSMISTLLTPVLLDRLGPGWAFGVPGVLMVLATICFWMGRDKFVHIPPAGGRFFTETFSRDGLRALANLAPLYFIFIAMFWALFDQTASAWVLQAEQMDRNVFGYELLSSQLQAVNPLLVMAMIPLFSYGLYPWLGRFFDVTPLRKIGIGLFVMVLGFAIPAWIQMQLDVGERPHIIWQVAAYLLLTASEVLVSITALEFSYTQAPNRLKSLMVGGFYLLSVTIGNKFVAEINRFIGEQKQQGASYLDGANYYWFFTACMLGTAVMYLLWSQFYRGQTFIQGDEPADPARVTGEP